MQESIRKLWKLLIVLGVLNAVFGLVVLFAPYHVPRTMELILAVIILLGGVASAIDTVISRKEEGTSWNVIMVVVRFVTATILLVGTPDEYMTAVVLLAIYFGLDGALTTGKGVSIRKQPPLHLYLIALGITSAVFSILLWLRVVGTNVDTLRTLVGILFLLRGAIIILGTLTGRKMAAVPEPPASAEEQSAPEPTA